MGESGESDERTVVHGPRKGSEPPEPTEARDTGQMADEAVGDVKDSEAVLTDIRRPAPQRLDEEGALASGGMGAISIAYDRALGRRIAKKSMHTMYRDDERLLRLFLREARTTGQLDHPNIVPVYDIGERDSELYFTMKLVQGQTLKELIRALPEGILNPPKLFNLLDVVIKVCDALAFAHSRSVLHCDIKPANVMVGDFGQVYLMDWGIARLVTSRSSQMDAEEVGPPSLAHASPSKDGRETSSGPSASGGGTILGTLSYMSPEQASGNRTILDARSDVFAVGALIYEILTRRPPYRGTREEILTAAQSGLVLPPSAVTQLPVPQELERIVLRAMARHRSDRYADTDELKEDLVRFMRGGGEFPKSTFPRGSFIVREGESGNAAYIIVSGRCEVLKNFGGTVSVLKSLGPGEVFGEMAVLSEGPRTASVLATDETTVMVVTGTALQQELSLLKPWMARLLQSVAERLRDLYSTKRVTLSGGPTSPRLCNQLLMHLKTFGQPAADGSLSGKWSQLAREMEAQMGAPPHAIHMVEARYPQVVLDLEHDMVKITDPVALTARLEGDLPPLMPYPDAALALLAFAVFTGVTTSGWIARRARARAMRIRAAWAKARTSLDGHARTDEEPLAIEAAIGTIDVSVAITKNEFTETVASAEAASALGLWFSATPDTLLSRLAGDGDVVPIDGANFVVRASSPIPWVRTFFEARAIRNAIAAASPYVITVQGGRARAHRDGVEEDAGNIVRIARVVAAVAQRAADVDGGWTRLARDIQGHVRRGIDWQTDAAITIARSGTTITLSITPEDDALVTRLSIEQAAERDVPEALHPRKGLFSLPQGEPATMTAKGVVMDGEAIDDAIAVLLHAAGVTETGPYR